VRTTKLLRWMYICMSTKGESSRDTALLALPDLPLGSQKYNLQ
jgi:hypothetical protein